jgi:hypothetical protein
MMDVICAMLFTAYGLNVDSIKGNKLKRKLVSLALVIDYGNVM